MQVTIKFMQVKKQEMSPIPKTTLYNNNILLYYRKSLKKCTGKNISHLLTLTIGWGHRWCDFFVPPYFSEKFYKKISILTVWS